MTDNSSESVSPASGSRRAQANLPAFAVAVLIVTSTATLSVLVADSAFTAADRQPLERTQATDLSAAMVDAGSPLTVRANVLKDSRVDVLDDRLASWFPTSTGVDVTVRLDDSVVARNGTPNGGTTVRRLVLVSTATPRVIEPRFTGSDRAVTLPRRTDRMTLTIDPPPGTTVRTVRVNNRVVLHDPGGLGGDYDVTLSRFQTATIRFDADRSLPRGSVRVAYRPTTTMKAVLSVTVDA